MIGEPDLDWAEIRKVVRRDDFIYIVVNFDPLALTEAQVELVTRKYLGRGGSEGFTYESVNRASKACGPLFSWASSQIKYATILRRIEPLRVQVASLTECITALQDRQDGAAREVIALEEVIETYKAEYAAAIREIEVVRTEVSIVQKKISRAESLLTSLAQEKERWSEALGVYDAARQTLYGDALIAASFLCYSGCFDNSSRSLLLERWVCVLEDLHIHVRKLPEEEGEGMDITSMLSSPVQQMNWKASGLNTDRQALENAILLERGDRYPLVIDPSGQAESFLKAQYAQKNLTVTSYHDPHFTKTLSSAIRFGNPLLVKDTDRVDPTLYPLLNKESRSSGGRTLIRLGTDEVDVSPAFTLFLLSADPAIKFAPALCSREYHQLHDDRSEP